MGKSIAILDDLKSVVGSVGSKVTLLEYSKAEIVIRITNAELVATVRCRRQIPKNKESCVDAQGGLQMLGTVIYAM